MADRSVEKGGGDECAGVLVGLAAGRKPIQPMAPSRPADSRLRRRRRTRLAATIRAVAGRRDALMLPIRRLRASAMVPGMPAAKVYIVATACLGDAAWQPQR